MNVAAKKHHVAQGVIRSILDEFPNCSERKILDLACDMVRAGQVTSPLSRGDFAIGLKGLVRRGIVAKQTTRYPYGSGKPPVTTYAVSS